MKRKFVRIFGYGAACDLIHKYSRILREKYGCKDVIAINSVPQSEIQPHWKGYGYWEIWFLLKW